MRLFIAEKPSLGLAIAEGLGIKNKNRGYIECQSGDVVTWVFGHFLELAPPHHYDEALQKWSFDNLPILPKKLEKLVKNDKGVLAQYKTIKGLYAKCKSVVNAGDPDREGQLLVDELLEDFNNKKPVERIWLASLDLKSTQKAIKEIKNNTEPLYKNMKLSAQARSEADWLYGMNLTRAMTLAMKSQGGHTVLSIGRVQTPTLAIVVDRENAILNFKPKDYYICQTELKAKGSSVTVNYLPEHNDNFGGDEEGYLVELDAVKTVVKAIREKAVVEEFNSTKKTTKQPLAYNLSTLQSEASSKLGFGAQQTLDLAQKLYEKKLTTYPRSDCGYLPEEQFNEGVERIKMLAGIFSIAKQADTTIKSPTWNTKKVSAHHGIIPTADTPSGLSDDEMKLYTLIAKKFIAQFFPPETYNAVSLTVKDADGYLWKATDKQVINPGWTAIYSTSSEKEASLPTLSKGDFLEFVKESVKQSQTKPPARFTEGSLIKAMENVANFVMNPNYKKILKSTSGLGTDATRSNIIETLFKRGFIKTNKKQLVPTELGMALVDVLTPKIKDPGVTAIWEQYLGAIESGKLTYDEFISEQRKFIPKYIDDIKTVKFPVDLVKKFPGKPFNPKNRK